MSGMGTGCARWGSLLAGFAFLAGVAGCGAGAGGDVGYKPPLVPVKFSVDSQGKPSVSGSKELVTPVGTFSIGAKYSLDSIRSDAVRVVIQNKKIGDTGSRYIYDVTTGDGEFTAVVNGKTTIQVSDRRVLIDVTEGTIESIQLKGIEPVADGTDGNWLAESGDRWENYWDTTFYSPMALSRWAYDDDTIDKWFGVGFLWFLLRLVFALVLGIADLVLLTACFLAAVAAMVFGDLGRNIVYGIEALALLAVVGATAFVVYEDYL
jgi:hypothetical protein